MPPIYGSADRLASQPRVYGPPAPPPRPVVQQAGGPSGREIVDRHTRGDKTDVKAVARDLRQEIRQRPQQATQLMMQALEHVKADDRDEVAQEFIREHADWELRVLGQSAAGKGALALAVNELAKGSVHKDEAKDAARVGDALGTKIELKVNTGWARVSGAIHTVLDIAGFIPGLGAIPDLINAGIYAAEGDWKNAAMSGFAAVPGLGDGAKATSMAVKGGRELLEQGVKHGDEVLDAGKFVARHGDEAAEAGAKAAKATVGEVTGRVGRNDVKWTVDANGSTVKAEATLREVFPGAKRSSAEVKAQSEAAALGKSDDVGGHIIGHRFVQDQGSKNLFPQNVQFNNSAYKKLENEWADWIKSGKEVQVDVRLSGGTATRPDKIEVFYKVVDPANGKTVMKNSADFTNEAGQAFDRVPSKSM